MIEPIYVIKRDKRLEPFDESKIRKMINWASSTLDVNPEKIYQEVLKYIVPEVSTKTINQQLIKICNYFTTIDEPHWSNVAANLILLEIFKNLKEYLGQENLFGYCSLYDFILKADSDNYISDVIVESYTKQEIEYLNQFIDISYDDLDYVGTHTLMKRFLLKHDGKVIEPPQIKYMLTAMVVFHNEKNKGERLNLVSDYYTALAKKQISPATPNLMNLSIKRGGSTPSCYEFKVEDNLESIYDGNRKFAIVSKNGGAAGINFSSIRAKGSPIRGKEGASKGVVPFLKLYNVTSNAVDQLGVRKAAATVALPNWHLDIFEFLNIRKENIDPRLQAQDLFGQIIYSDIFLRIYKESSNSQNEKDDWLIFCPYEFNKLTGQKIEDLYGEKFEEGYLKAVELFQNGTFKNAKMTSTRKIMRHILEAYTETGLPYAFFNDYTNQTNPNKHVGPIYNANLCVAPETNILTKEGQQTISNLEGKTVEVWNGYEWSKVLVLKTGENAELVEVVVEIEEERQDSPFYFKRLKRTLNCTLYHKWRNSNNEELRTHELVPGLELLSYGTPSGYVRKSTVVSVTYNGRKDDTYCFTEHKRNLGVFNDILTGQCVESFSSFNENMSHVCALHSVVLTNIKSIDEDPSELEHVVKLSVKALNRIAELSTTPLKCTENHVKNMRIIGVGALGYADHLAKNKMSYIKSADYIYRLMELVAYYSIEESVNEVSNYGEYNYFCGSEWEKGIFFGREVDSESFTKTENMKQKWIELKNKVQKYGMANGGLIAIAPNTTTSTITHASASILPVYNKVFQEENSVAITVKLPKYLNRDTFWFYPEAVNMNPLHVINILQHAQQWVDQGISSEIVINKNLYPSAIDVRNWFLEAQENSITGYKLKTLYYSRPIDVDKADSCESCAN